MIEIKRAALYARFSSDNQRTESIYAQIRAMRQFCNQNKWKIVETYVDEAYSATTDRRPDFQCMIEDSGKGLFDIVLVHKLDRFSRNRYYSAIYKHHKRNLVEATMYVAKTGCQRRALLHDYPPYSTVYNFYSRAKKKGTWEKVM